MVRRTRNRSAFWFFVLILALGAGWAANQDWRWPLLALFDDEGEPDGQARAPEVVAGKPADGQPTDEQATVEQPARQPTGEDPATDAPPAATDPAAPAERDLAAPSPASDQAPAQEPVSDAAGPTGEPAEAEVATIDTADTEGEAGVEPAASESSPDSSGPVPADDLPALGEAEGDATDLAATGDLPPGPESEAETEAEAGPSFDLVRVGRDGRAVIAGRATPGAEVEVRSGAEVIDRVQATRRGEWVAIPARPLAPGDQELSAVALRDGTAVESGQVVVVAVPQPTTPTMAVAATGATDPAQPVAVLLPRDGKGSGRILQAPGRLSAEGTLALMTVSYDDSGEVLLSGEAPPGVPVRIYVDNRPAALVVGDAKGGWSSGLGEALPPGTYTLRLDQLDGDGQAVARIETPFTRASEPPVEGNLQVDYVVVQPGNSLWRIARRLSGKGLDYVHIYDSNQTQIRNPDLIYPGQVFEIPGELDPAG